MNVWRRLLCVIALLLCLPLTVRAAETSHLTVGEAAGRRGDTVTVDVSLDQVNGIAGGSFNVVYDSQSLALVSAEAGIGGGSVNPHYRVDAVRISFAGTAPLRTPGSLLTLTFRIKPEAPLELLPIRIEGQRFYDQNAGIVSADAVAGGVLVQAVASTLSSDNCLPGQAVKLEFSLGGGLYPAGGEFDLTYNPRLLTAGSVKGEQKMGNTAISFSYNLDVANGVIHVVWAAAEPIGAHGRLCTVIFAVSDNAAGETRVHPQNMKFFDENGSQIEFLTPEDGVVTVVDQYQEKPSLYVVGGRLDSDSHTATVQIALDGAGIVCGGTFQASYDPALCTLVSVTPKMSCVVVNPESTDSADGTIAVSWAEDSPALDNETVLELTFQMRENSSAPLTLANAVLKDNKGRNVENPIINGGKVGINSSVQDPVSRLVQGEQSIGIQATLYDAEFCGDVHTSAAKVILATYSDGKLSLLILPPDAVSFDHNGIAQVSANLQYDQSISALQMFIVDSEGEMTPLCEKVEFCV